VPSPQNREEVLFAAALEVPLDKRPALLDAVCFGDPALRQRLETLLAPHQKADELPPSGAPAVVATIKLDVAEAEDEAVGKTIGRYKVLEKVGEGGCGVVYVAEQTEPVRRRVALKVIKLGMDTKQVVARFEAERQALAMMDHPNIAKVLDAGATENGRPFFVMELVRGIKITEYCDQNNLTTKERLDLFIKVCQAIQHAHQKGIIHRDIKPSNILVTLHDGVPVPKVIDFGIAKATVGQTLTEKTVYTELQQFIGTPAYMSPEQAEMSGLDIDTRSDIYSLGVLLYELLTGSTPFDAKELAASGVDAMRKTIREKEPVRPSTRLATLKGDELTTTAKRRSSETSKLLHQLKGDLDWIVMKSLEKDRTRRYETANGLATDIQRHLKNEPVVARPPSNLYRLQKMVRRNKLAIGAAAAVALSVVITLGISILSLVKETNERRLAVAAEKTAKSEAERADRHAAEEAVQRKRADTEADAATLNLADSYFSQALRLIAEDRGGDALAYLARNLSIVPTNEAALNQIASLLNYHSWMVADLSLKHDSWVMAAQFSPDGKRILTASLDGTARVWDAQTGQAVGGLLKHDREVSYAEFSPDGKRIVTGCYDGAARIWDAQTGHRLIEFKHGVGGVMAEFSYDGKRILTRCFTDATVRVWDAETGAPLARPLQHREPVLSAHFSPDGKWIATASYDKTARIWDAQTGQALTGALQHNDVVYSAEFSPDGLWIVTASRDATARVWNAQTGQPSTPLLKHSGAVTYARFSPDGKWIVTASADHAAHIWDARTGQLLSPPLQHGGDIYSAQFSGDGKRIVTASNDHTARVWDAQTGRPIGEPLKHSGRVLRASFSPDGKRIVTGSVDGEARVWSEAGEKALTIELTHSASVASAHFNPDGTRIVTASADHTVRVWDAQTGQPVTKPLSHGSNVVSAEFSFDGKRIVTASMDGAARVWDAESGLPLTDPLQHADQLTSAHFSPDGNWIATASYDKTARIWDAQTGRPRAVPLWHDQTVASAQFSPDGKWVATASWDKTARVWDAVTGQPVTKPLPHVGRVYSVQFSPDGKRIVTASIDGTARVWDAQTGQLLAHCKEGGDRFPSAQFSPDGKWIATASLGGMARVWDAQTGEPRAGDLNHGDIVWTAQFSADGKRVVTASEDHTARVWDAKTGLPLTLPLAHRHEVSSAEFSPDGKWIVTTEATRYVSRSQDREIHRAVVWDVAPLPATCPSWLGELVEAVSGQKVGPKGALEETKLNRTETLKQIRKRLIREPDDDPWVQWGRWFLADPATRTISPSSKVTVPEYVKIQLQEGTAESLDEAERLANGDAYLLQHISDARHALEQTNQPAASGGAPK
jgi:WD40 repeat protein/serine/threonine protein kinase